MGRFRKYMPYTAIAFVIAFLAIAGVPPFAGFWAKDGVLEKAFQADQYGLWIVGAARRDPHRRLHDPPGLPRRSTATSGSDGDGRGRRPSDAEPEHADDDGAHVVTIDPATPTVSYGDPPHTPVLHHEPHEGNGLMVSPVVAARRPRGDRRAARPALPAHRVARRVAGAGVRRRAPEIASPSFLGGVGLSVLAILMGLIGLGAAYALYRRGLESVDRDPFDERLGVFGRLFGHAYYYDEGISRLVDGPLRGFAGWLAWVVDAKIIDGAVNGVGLARARDRGRLPTVAERLRAQLRARGRARHRRAARVPPDLGGALMHDSWRLPDPHRDHRRAGDRRAGLSPHPGGSRRGGARGRVRGDRGHPRPRRSGCSGTSRPVDAGYQFVESERWMGSIGVKYVVGVDGISLFMIVAHRAAVPDRAARVGEAHRTG